jgi:hypothetical protein
MPKILFQQPASGKKDESLKGAEAVNEEAWPLSRACGALGCDDDDDYQWPVGLSWGGPLRPERRCVCW